MTGSHLQNSRLGYARVSTYGQTLDTQLDERHLRFIWRSRSRLLGIPSTPCRREGLGRGQVVPGAARLSARIADPAVAHVAAARTVLDIIGLDLGKAVGLGELGALVEIVEAYRILGEDRVLDGAVGRPQRLEAVSLLHFVRDLEAAQPLDLPLRRTGP